jgi:hypothetical protein
MMNGIAPARSACSRILRVGRALLFALVAVTSVYACGPRDAEPSRPANLPADAFWLGGPDGGVYVRVQRVAGTDPRLYSGAVYHPDGAVWYEGEFLLEPAAAQLVEPSDTAAFLGWDGTQLLLEGSRSLVARGMR